MAGRTYYSPWTGERLPSVTTVLGEWNKPGLVGWAARLGAETGDPLAYRSISEAKALTGHRVHEAVRTGHWPDDLRDFQHQYDLAWRSRPFEILSQELPVYHPRFAGTYDLIVQFFDEDDPSMLDLKTSEKGIYEDTVRLQIAAYRFASTTPYTDSAVVLHLRPDHFELREVDAGEEEFAVFMNLLEVREWSRKN